MQSAAHRARRLLIRAWPLLLALAIIMGLPLLLQLHRNGRVAVRALVYLPDMVFQVPLPFRPVDLISDPPHRERVVINYQSRNGPRSIEADLYTPAGGTGHAGVVFSMGAPPLDLDDDRLVRIAEDTARAGVVILVPFSERLDEERIETEEIDALVSEFEYLQSVPGVDPDRVGFFGASVGGSLALVAAADPRIAEDVDHVVSFGGYYDALTAFGAVATGRIQYEDVDEEWDPKRHAERVMAKQIILRVQDDDDRALLWDQFVRNRPQDADRLASLGAVGRNSYDFLANRDPAAVQDLIARLPDDAVEELEYLSPSAGVDNLQAELFIVHDRADPYIPYTESRRLEDAVGDRVEGHFDEIRLFEHVSPKLTQRPEIIALDSTRVMLRLYQLLLRWD